MSRHSVEVRPGTGREAGLGHGTGLKGFDWGCTGSWVYLQLEVLVELWVSNSVGNVAGGDVFARRIAMDVLVVEEDICTECCQERSFWLASQEKCFINTDAPLPQCQDDTLVGRR